MSEHLDEPLLEPLEIRDAGDVNAVIRERGGAMAFRPHSFGETEEDDLIEPLMVRIVDQVGDRLLIRLQVDTLNGEMVSSVIMKPGDLQDLLDVAMTPVATG